MKPTLSAGPSAAVLLTTDEQELLLINIQCFKIIAYYQIKEQDDILWVIIKNLVSQAL